MGSFFSVTSKTASGRSISQMLRLTGDLAEDALAAALNVEAENIMAASKEIVPIDTGILAASGHVRQPLRVNGKITIVMAYGGVAAPYALRQHEDLALNHPNGRQAKYLERPFLEAKAGMSERVANRMRRRLDLGGWRGA